MADLGKLTHQELLDLAYGDDQLVGLAAIRELRADLAEREQVLVAAARKFGRRTWSEIGEALGTTRQGAFNRYGDIVKRFEETGTLSPASD